jgi:hypothetical protein
MGGFEYIFIVVVAIIVVTLITQRKTLEKAQVDGFKITRGYVISNGTIIYRVEIDNELPSVVNEVTATLMVYPKECMAFIGQETKIIPMIESGVSKKLEFQFTPTKDYVEGEIQVSISYMDANSELQTIHLEPFAIHSVFDFITPVEIPVEQFDLLLSELDAISEKVILETQAEILFETVQTLLPIKNFYIMDTEMYVDCDIFTGTIRGYAEGKYTQKTVAIILTITGTLNVNQSVVKVQAHGDNIIMLHTIVNEVVSEL